MPGLPETLTEREQRGREREREEREREREGWERDRNMSAYATGCNIPRLFRRSQRDRCRIRDEEEEERGGGGGKRGRGEEGRLQDAARNPFICLTTTRVTLTHTHRERDRGMTELGGGCSVGGSGSVSFAVFC